MKSASNLTEEQKKTVFQWAEEGASLQDVQKRLGEEFGLRFTFMETRFLAGDLNLPIRSEAKVEPESEEVPAEGAIPDSETFEGEGAGPDDPVSDGPGIPVPTVTVDQITTPGTLVSGKVAFPSGKKASWALDQFGRLSLNPDDPEFRPSQPEIVAFQQELQRVARKQGF